MNRIGFGGMSSTARAWALDILAAAALFVMWAVLWTAGAI